MMVRNPFRPWWIHVWRHTPFDRFVEAFAAEIVGTNFGGDRRIRWAARHACKRLRQRLAEVERERDDAQQENARLRAGWEKARGLLRSWQDAEAIRRELELDRTPQEIVTAEHNRRVVAEAQLAAAKQENARLRGTLQRIEDSDAALSNYGLCALVHNALAACEEKP